jgi:hypothetical protein
VLAAAVDAGLDGRGVGRERVVDVLVAKATLVEAHD